MFRTKYLALLLLPMIGLAGYQLWNKPAHSEASRPTANARPVVAATARLMDLSEAAVVTGTAEANTYVEICPEVNGRVVAIPFAEGTMIEKGAVLVQLDDRAAAARRDEAKAESLNANQQLRRAQPLRSTAAIPAARIDELQAAVGMAEARLRAAEIELEQHSIKAPFTGVVGLRRVSIGAQVGPADILTTLDDSRTINVLFRVPDIWLASIHPDLEVGLLPAQDDSTRLTGRVVAIDSRVDSINRTIGIKAVVDNSAGLIKPGSLVKVAVPLASKQNAVTIPEQALLMNGDRQTVFVIEGDTVKSHDITPGLRQRGVVEVLDGLTAGQQVVAAGGERLREGSKIQVGRVLDGWQAQP